MEGCIHFRIVKYERIKFLVIGMKDAVEIYAWAPKPYHKFMAFKVRASLYSQETDTMVANGQSEQVVHRY